MISLMINTASIDCFLQEHKIDSYFRALTENLKQQTFTDFELIYVDTFYDDNAAKFADIIAKLPYQVKHVGVHPEHRYWYDQNYCYISAAKNTGILYADGDLLITCDDAEFFPAQFLERYWHHYKEGRRLHALHRRMTAINVEDGVPTMPISGSVYQNDHRWKKVQSKDTFHHKHGGLTFAGTSFSLNEALRVNGFNERMDGCKSLEDCDFGGRLAMLTGVTFALDKEAYAYIVDHPSYSTIRTTVEDGQQSEHPVLCRKPIESFIAVENYGMLRCAEELLDPVANKNPLTDAHFKIIQRATLKYRNFDPLAPEHKEKLDIWLRTPMFDLRNQREALRHSPAWRW